MAGKILVVDDEEIIRESLSFVLKKEGYSVDEAADGEAAYKLVLENFYDFNVL